MYSGEDMDLGKQELVQEDADAALFKELGFGDDLLFHPEEIIISGDLMLSPALTLSDLEVVHHEMEKVKFTVTSETPGTSKMGDVKPELTNQCPEPARVKVGVNGRRRRSTGNATKVKDEIAEVLRLRPPRKIKPRVSQHVPEEKKTAEYYEHRRRNTEAARKCREKKRGVDEKRVEIIKKQNERMKELEAKVASLEHDNNIYKVVIVKLGQNPPVSQGLQSPPQVHQRLPKKSRRSHRRDRK